MLRKTKAKTKALTQSSAKEMREVRDGTRGDFASARMARRSYCSNAADVGEQAAASDHCGAFAHDVRV